MFAPKVTKPEAKPASDATRKRATPASHPLGHDPVGQALLLQRTVGNQATLGILQRQSRSAGSEPQRGMAPLFARSAAPDDIRGVLSDRGHPLDPVALRAFQSSFGYDLSPVRVHTDERAAASATSVSARAYTVGSHIVFGRGEYAPGTTRGRHLLGHELAHVVQQSRGGSAAPGDPVIERAADHAADQAARGGPVTVAGGSAVGLACKTLFEEFTGGHYVWPLLKGAIEATRPVDDIAADINGLPAAERSRAINDVAQARFDLGTKQADLSKRWAALTDPKDQALADQTLGAGQRVLDRIDGVLNSLAGHAPIPGWNFTPSDFAKLRRAGKDLTIAPDSAWFPARFQDNLLKTLAFVLGPQPLPATEGVNARDLFHGHLIIKKDPATAKAATAATAKAGQFDKELLKGTRRALGPIHNPNYTLTPKQIADYGQELQKLEPSLATLLEDTAKIPGAAVTYHTFEFNQPSDVRAAGRRQPPEDTRRQILTPLDTNVPTHYTPPAGATYEKEYTHIVRFVFLIDATGAVHVRPVETTSGFTTLQLSTITGTTFPEPLQFE